jgi:hypothetical protein
LSNGRNVRRLKALWTLNYVETNSLPFRECPKTLHLDLTEVDEEILPLRLLNESVALFGTKPLDSPLSQPYNLHVFGATRSPAHPTLTHTARSSPDTRRYSSGTRELGQGLTAENFEISLALDITQGLGVTEVLETVQGLGFHLPDALPRHAKALSHFFQGPGALALEAKTQFKHLAIAGG